MFLSPQPPVKCHSQSGRICYTSVSQTIATSAKKEPSDRHGTALTCADNHSQLRLATPRGQLGSEGGATLADSDLLAVLIMPSMVARSASSTR
jgi:hypothetical protein